MYIYCSIFTKFFGLLFFQKNVEYKALLNIWFNVLIHQVFLFTTCICSSIRRQSTNVHYLCKCMSIFNLGIKHFEVCERVPFKFNKIVNHRKLVKQQSQTFLELKTLLKMIHWVFYDFYNIHETLLVWFRLVFWSETWHSLFF